jgi:RNA polymerase sigma factor (sigma-70 family)
MKPNAQIDEKVIIRKCKNNDRQFQKILFERHYGKLMGICMRYSKDKFQAQDYLQESFIKIFNNLEKYESTGSFEGWISRLTKNHIIDQVRKNKTIYLSENEYDITRHKEEVEEEEFLYSEKISPQDIINELQKLTECQRTIFNMFIVEEKSHEQISKLLNINIGTSKSNLHKAKKNLKKLLKRKIR